MIEPHVDPRTTVAALRQALPYLRIFQGKTFVVKCGGEIFDDLGAFERLLEQVGILHRLGIRLVFLHGGGPQMNRNAERLGLETTKVGGRRVTDPGTLDVALMTMRGVLNARAVALCRKLGTPAVGISALDGDLVVAEKRPPQEIDGETVDFGEVGDVRSVDTGILDTLLDDGRLPVVCPICSDENGRILNVNADTVAARLAGALNADKLIILTGAPGILEDASDETSLISLADRAELDRLVAGGSAQGGMLPKINAATQALDAGVPRVHIISYRIEDSLLAEIFTNEGSGTMILADATETA